MRVRGVLVLTALVAVVVGLVLWVAEMMRFALHPVVVPVAIWVMALSVWLAWPRGHADAAWPRAPRDGDRVAQDRHLRELVRAVHGARDARTWQRTVSPLLMDLVAHRLRQHHQVDLRSEPDRARALLPPELRALVDDPATPPKGPRELSTIITRIEEL